MEDPTILQNRSGKISNRGGRGSLLGLPSRDGDVDKRKVQQQNEELMEKENDRKIGQLGDTVLSIKMLSKDIESGIDQSNRNMDHMVCLS